LRTAKKKRRGVINDVDQNFSPIFHWAIYKYKIKIRRNPLISGSSSPTFELKYLSPFKFFGVFSLRETESFLKGVVCPVKIEKKF